MKTLKEFLSASKANVALFVVTVCLVLFSTVSAARAAIETYASGAVGGIQMYDIGVTLQENGSGVSWRNYTNNREGTWDEKVPGVLLQNMLLEGEELVIGKVYSEELNVYNSGTINQYTRVTIYRYWIEPDKEGQVEAEGDLGKLQTLDPSLIDLHLVNLGSAWLEDEGARTNERTVLYYNRLLYSGDQTPLFADTITIDGTVAAKASQTILPNGTVKTVYAYDGAMFMLEVHVDSVQENNAQDAVTSAWGAQVIIDPVSGTLSLR